MLNFFTVSDLILIDTSGSGFHNLNYAVVYYSKEEFIVLVFHLILFEEMHVA
jgi:hypothetical protein